MRVSAAIAADPNIAVRGNFEAVIGVRPSITLTWAAPSVDDIAFGSNSMIGGAAVQHSETPLSRPISWVAKLLS